MLFAGFNVFQGHLTLIGIIVFGVLGDMVGASIAYAIGYFGRRELVERQGNKLHVSSERLDRAHRWFERYGAAGDRRLADGSRSRAPRSRTRPAWPGCRSGASSTFATIGSIVWIAALGVLGQRGRQRVAELAPQPRVRRLRRRRRARRARSRT